MNKGTIALDIDGTITGRDHLIPNGVARYFEMLHKEGWQFIFVTGRPLSFALMTITKLEFPYLLALQNGADLIEMPTKKRVHRAYLTIDVVLAVDELYQNDENDILLYSGYERGDRCYFRSNRFSEEMLSYFKKVESLSALPWKDVTSFERCGQSTFPLIKCVGSKEMLESFDQKLKTIEGIKTSMITDPISRKFHLLLITHEAADKGKAVKKFMELYHLKRPLITGGDDNNDFPLLKLGDVRIAIDGSPQSLQDIAHIIAPLGSGMGMIEALQEGIRRTNDHTD